MASLDTPVMEGYLEKQSSGVSRFLGKSRFWCTLQGECLQYYKESKRSSVVESLMLNEAQMVRKTSGAKQGTQFEIITKKQRTLLFTAATAIECSNWVRHLQQAMIHKDRTASGRRRAAPDAGYEEIVIDDAAAPSLAPPENKTGSGSNTASAMYADVVDCLALGGPPERVLSSSSNMYAEVADFLPRTTDDGSGPPKTNPDVFRENSLYVINKAKETMQEERQQTTPIGADDTAIGYSTLDSYQDTTAKTQETKNPPHETKPDALPEYATVQKVKESGQMKKTVTKSVSMDEEWVEGAAIENLDSALKRIPAASDLPIWNSLTAGDRKPLDDLKEFLANNRELCRTSYTRLDDNIDPVARLKGLLQEIG
ncbi:pleckstrin homology domain-containing family A member 7-like [Haliotis cracherodii]|uniref:pleckstrin homology domain-containing family A member 7-like n=1 Tax=Haliotis cracherodii TaxID=6455 RepID=UPI0039EBF450